jgi:mono/diheme cytochrome c family protein
MRSRPLHLVVAGLSVLAFVGAGCGGDEGGDTTTGGGDTAAGREIFTSNCGGCHTLADAGTTGDRAPNLDDIAPDEATVEEQVRNGGGGMPAFEGDLSDQQITDVSAYVASVAGQ